MGSAFRFHWLFFVLCLLSGGSAAFAQEATGPGDHAAADQNDAHGRIAEEAVPAAPPAVYRHESLAMWIVRSMGVVGVLVLGAGAFCFVVTLLVTIRGQGPFACAALVLLVPIPFLIGLFGMGKGIIASFQVIAFASVDVKASEICTGISEALVTPMLGLVVMVPSYLVGTLGSIIRSFAKPSDSGDGQS